MAEPTQAQLATFQAALLELLSRDTSLAALQAALRAETALTPFQAYVEEWQPQMLETAAQLVKQWGRR